MKGLDMAAVFAVADHLAEDIAQSLSVAADDADVVISTYTDRSHDADLALAEALVRRLVDARWTFMNAEDAVDIAATSEANDDPPEPKDEPEVRAVTGTHHQAGPVRRPVGRKAVGFQHTPPTEGGAA